MSSFSVYLILIGISMVIGGLIYMFVIYPMFFSPNDVLFIIDIIGIVAGIILAVIGIIITIAD